MEKLPAVALELLAEAAMPSTLAGEPGAKIFALPRSNTASYRAVNALLRQGFRVASARQEFAEGDSLWPAGTFLIEVGKHSAKLKEMLRRGELTTSRHGNPGVVVLYGLKGTPRAAAPEPVHQPRIGVYKSWMASMDEGWTRWVLEEYGFEFQALTNDHLQLESLRNSYDVLIFPDQNAAGIVNGYSAQDMPAPFAGGIGENGIANLRRFVATGGTLIALNAASEFAIKYFQLNLTEATANVPRLQFSAPGSVLRVQADLAHPLAWGAEKEEAVFFLDSPAFRLPEGPASQMRAILTYPAGGLLLSGWLEGEKTLAGNAALVEASYSKGRLILFGCRPQFRAQFRSGYKFLFNALLRAAN